MSFIQRVNACNSANTSNYLLFVIDDRQVGWIKPAFARQLADWPRVFSLNDKSVRINDAIKGFHKRSEAIDEVIRSLVQKKVIRAYLDEPYPVTAGDRNDAIMTMDRSAGAFFGIRCFGQHLNGYVRRNDGIHLWIARRAKDRHIEPGKLDNMVAGGLPWHISLEENLIKECAEEAGMSASLASHARAVGTVSYLAESVNGIKPDTLYCYDIELPEDFTPVCTDGEVESFHLMPVEEVMQIIRDSEDFKPNCNLVILDFLVRHGLLKPEEKGYTNLVSSLHQKL
jgi:isopentenyldiphosphate isomerase